MVDFLKKNWGYFILNAILTAFTALTLFTQPLSAIGYVALMCVLAGFWITVPYLVLMNVLSYEYIKTDYNNKGLIFAALGGFIGAFISAHKVNKAYSKTWIVNIIFNIWLYIAVIYPLMVGFLFLIGFYNVL